MQENCNAILVSPQVNELNVACHGNVEFIFERERTRKGRGWADTVKYFLIKVGIKPRTLYSVILRIARNLLETRENIKIESHLFYHIICD